MKRIFGIFGIGVALVFGAEVADLNKTSPAPQPKSAQLGKNGACFLLKVYNQCRQKGEQEQFAGDKLKCLKFAYGLQEYLKQKLPIKDEKQRDEVAMGLGKICYTGCIKDPDVERELKQKCNGGETNSTSKK